MLRNPATGRLSTLLAGCGVLFAATLGALAEAEPSPENLASALAKAEPSEITDRELAALEDALRKPGNEEVAIPFLLKLFTNDNWVVREKSAKLLAAIGKLPPLQAALSDPDTEVQRYSAEAIGLMGPSAKAAIPQLIALLDSPMWTARMSAAKALGRIGPAAAEALPKLSRGFEDNNYLKTSYSLASAQISGQKTKFMPPIIEVIETQLPNPPRTVNATLTDALEAVVVLGPDAQSALPALIKLIEREDFEVMASEIMPAIGSIGPAAKDAVPLLQKRLTETPTRDRERIHRALRSILGTSYDAEALIAANRIADKKAREAMQTERRKTVASVTYELPEVTRIEILELDIEGLPKNGKTFQVPGDSAPVAIRAEAIVTGADCAKLARAWRSMEFPGDSGMFCHDPIYGLRFFQGDKVLLKTSVCWGCRNFFAEKELYGFGKGMKALEEEISRLLPGK